ncbi:MAG: tyrosine-type recombinase/integrase [Mycobacterium sp.]
MESNRSPPTAWTWTTSNSPPAKGTLRVLGKGDKIREIPIHPQLRTDLHRWLHERPDWPEATRNPALLLNNRGGRLTTRGASGIFRQIADNAGLDAQTTAHILRHHPHPRRHRPRHRR